MRLLIQLTLLTVLITNAHGQTPKAHSQWKNDLMRQKVAGKVRSITEKEYNGSGDSLKLRAVSTYNDSGNMASFITYSPEGEVLSRTSYKYNDSGKLAEENRYKADGTLNVRTTCIYDARGNKIEEDNFDAGGVMFLKVLNKFDGKGNRIVKDSYNEFGSLFLKCNSKFDEDGNEESSKEFDSHHGLKYSTTYEYKDTDKEGNWQKKTTYKNDEPSAVTEREIEYR